MNDYIKILLAATCLSGSYHARGDDEVATGRYWFDHNSETVAFTPGQLNVATDGLDDGVHLFNAYVEKDGVLSSPASCWFFKSKEFASTDQASLIVSIDGRPYKTLVGNPVGATMAFDLDVAGLTEGLHSIDASAVIDGSVSSSHSRWFYKPLELKPGEKYVTSFYIDGKPWDIIETLAADGGILSADLDMNSLSYGLHTIQAQMMSTSGVVSGMCSGMFVRVPTDSEISGMKAYYVLDNNVVGEMAGTASGNVLHFDIDASALTPGLHSVSVYLAGANGLITSMDTAWFVKIPLGGEGVKKYEYWINDNLSSKKTVELDNVANPFSLISLIGLDKEPFRSSQYMLNIENDVPTAYAQNDFQLLFYDSEGRISYASKKFTDVRVSRPVTDITPVGLSTEYTIPNIDDNTIKWYGLEAEIGDSIAIRLDRGAMYELWSPNAELLMSANGADAVNGKGISLTANGKYYIAVHDISSYNKYNLKAYIEHIPRFALLSSSPEKATNKGFLMMNVRGNGFDKLKSVELSDATSKFVPINCEVSDKYNLSILFDQSKSQLSTGVYSLTAVFDDEGEDVTVKLAEAIEIMPASKSAVHTEVIAPRVIGTPYRVYVDVVNDSDQSCWGVPVNIAVADTENGIALELMDFLPFDTDSVSSEVPEYFNTDNLLGTGKPGVMIPLCIPYIGPNDKVRLTLGFYSGPHDHVPVYAWNGQPWSDEFEEILADDFDAKEITEFKETNLVSAREIVYASLVDDLESQQSQSSMQKVAGQNGLIITGIGSSVVRNIALEAHDAAQRVFHQLMTNNQTGLARNMIFLNSGNNWGLNDYYMDLFRLFPTMNKLKIKITIIRKHGDGGGDDGGGGNNGGSGSGSGVVASSKPTNNNPMPPVNMVDCYQSGDPNEMHGYISPSGDIFINPDVKNIEYSIEFENDPEIANAPAAKISVSNTLVKNRFNFNSFKPISLKLGGKEMELPDLHHFIVTMDMRPEISTVAELAFDFDADNGKATWNLRSLDPMTMDETKYMDDGILPVNDATNRGIGYLTYSIDLLPTLSDGIDISNSATIIFDDNDPIDTPVWTNITDYLLPTARITSQSIAEDGLSVDFEVDGYDKGSGIWYYDLYMRKADSNEWSLAMTQIEDDYFTYVSETPIVDYTFAIVAVDRAGNRQNVNAFSALLGDADANGSVDANDVVATRNYYIGVSTEINIVNADVNLDGKIDAQDAISIRNLYIDNSKSAKIARKRISKRQ